MKRNAIINFDESSLHDAAMVLMVVNPLDWGSAAAIVHEMKSYTREIMEEKEDKQFTHWGTAGFYVTVFPCSDAKGQYRAAATLMPYTMTKYINRTR